MTFLSAYDDFVNRTLAAVPGWLGKLEYVSGLVQPDGNYDHWGMIRIYGPEATQRAARQAHRHLIAQILRTPLKEMLKDAETSGAPKHLSSSRYVEELLKRAESLIPKQLSQGSASHFSSVLHALSALARRQEASSTPTS